MEVTDIIGKTFVSQRCGSDCDDYYTAVTYKDYKTLILEIFEEDGTLISSLEYYYQIAGKAIHTLQGDNEFNIDWYYIEWISSTEYVAKSNDGTKELYAIQYSSSDSTTPRQR